MTPQDWIAVGAGTAALLAAARLGLRGGQLDHRQMCQFTCPRFHEAVTCTARQDVRTGQWTHIETCSAFGDPEKLLCGQDCRRLMNLGQLRPRIL